MMKSCTGWSSRVLSTQRWALQLGVRCFLSSRVSVWWPTWLLGFFKRSSRPRLRLVILDASCLIRVDQIDCRSRISRLTISKPLICRLGSSPRSTGRWPIWHSRSRLLMTVPKLALPVMDKDIEALDDCVTHCCDECDCVKGELCVAKGKIKVLEECSRTQWEMIDQLMTHVENMEGKLCHCGKGRDHQVLGEVSVLGSPLVLGWEVPKDTGSNNSYHTPPIASSSIGPSSSLANANKENTLIIYDSCALLLQKIKDEPIEEAQPLPVLALLLDFTSVSHLVAVCGQCAIRCQGCPHSTFHPYAFCYSIGAQSTCWAGRFILIILPYCPTLTLGE